MEFILKILLYFDILCNIENAFDISESIEIILFLNYFNFYGIFQ